MVNVSERICIATVTNDLQTDQRMQRICDALTEHFDKVILVGRTSPNQKSLSPRKFSQVRLPIFFQKGFLFYAEYNIRLFWYLWQAKPNTIWSVDLDSLLPGVWVARMHSCACVYDAHEYYVESPEIVHRPKLQKFWSIIANYAIPKAQAHVTVGPELAKIMGQRYQVDFEVLRNVPFAKQDSIEPRTVPHQPILLYQGALNIGRGLEPLIEAMRQLPNCILWIAGAGDIELALRKQAVNLGNQVVFLGRLSPEALQKVTIQANIGINLLENKGQSYYYSLANKAFDYLQAGLPALHMDFPEYQLFKPAAALLPDLQVDNIVRAVQQLLIPDRYTEASRNALHLAQSYHWDIEKKAIEKVLKLSNM